jgi:hypothetical protein
MNKKQRQHETAVAARTATGKEVNAGEENEL